MVRQKRLPRPRLLTTDVVQIPLGAAIVDIKVARISGPRGQGMAKHQNSPSVSQSLPGFFVVIGGGNAETHGDRQKCG
jgi:hypothetical protein